MKRLTTIRDLRTEILELLSEANSPVQMLDMSKKLRIRADSDDYEQMRELLNVMADEGALMRHSRRRYSLPSFVQTADGLRGVLSTYHDNATVKTDDPEMPVVHIKRQHMLTALDGDVVQVRPHAIPKDRKVRGEVVAIIERSAHPISGTIEYDGAFYYLIPDEAKYHVDFLVSEKNLNGAKPGDKALATFVRWEHANASPEASVKEVFGLSGKATVEFAAIRKEFRLPAEFPSRVEAEAAAYAQPTSSVPPGRTNLLDELIVTIDPVDARDFDDALSLRQLANGNVELGVHIADVSHYVTEGSALDLEALLRGNSTYLVDGVVPMLPEHLSNDICSLVPHKPRFAYSVFMEFTASGERTSYRIEESVIESKRRYSYEEAQEIIDTGVGDNADLILRLQELAKTLFALRMTDGGIDFETQEVKFLLDENKMPVKAVVKTRTDATSLVEECMLAANRTVAEHLHVLKAAWKTKEMPPYVYRVHDQPDKEKMEAAVGIIRALGFDVPSGRLTPPVINGILKQAADRVEKPVVNTLFLRSMAKAVYTKNNIGHFGLGFADYAHFTSPIRRYPDLYVHRALKEYAKGQPERKRWSELKELAGHVGEQCSLTERAAVEAERASVKCAQTMLAREHIGTDHIGYVTGVAQFGVFVTLNDLMIEGLLHMRDINDDYYVFDEKRMRLYGRKNKRVFRYGSLVRVRIAKANVEKRMIDLVLSIDQVEEVKKKSGKAAPKRRTRES
ncbi:MAG: ribonuclease R [Candidatus Kapabacteria bacterium]|nr:ribonuclease R [Candidatus Kapabacteria bacterium]